MESASDRVLKDGNHQLSELVLRHVALRHAATEAEAMERFSKDPNIDVQAIMTMKKIDATLTTETTWYTHTRTVCSLLSYTYVFTEQLLKLYNRNKRNKQIVQTPLSIGN